MPRPQVRRTTLASGLVYLVLLAAALAEKPGRITDDTKAALVTAPAALLRSTFSLWNPQMSFGELQNQAYGYLFPMGPFFAGLHAAQVPDWVTERLWSLAVLVVACEGARLVARNLGLAAWPAWLAGMAYGLNPRMLSEIGVRSAEVLPGAVLPWVLLPVLLALRGRLAPRRAAVLSAAAFLFSGAVNGTATVAPLPLVVVFLLWGVRRGLVRWSFAGWWAGLVVVGSVWWASSLLALNRYSPPFFDYVEDARTTTRTTGFESSLRGLGNWVGYLTNGDRPTWPAAWDLGYSPALVVVTGLIAAVGLVGLVRMRTAWRTPLVISAVVGLVCLTVGHTATWLGIPVQSPLASRVQDLLDGPFALLRNVAKIDPVLRLPLAVGVGVLFGQLLGGAARARRTDHRPRGEPVRRSPGRLLAPLLPAAVAGLVLVSTAPALTLDLRTPGWTRVPDYWTRTATYLHDQGGANRAWVVPGSGFGIQTWGWTLDEPMSMVARSPWVTRSQVPLAPPATITMLDSLEDLLASGAGSPRLGDILARVGLGYVVVRHDLDPSLAEAPAAALLSLALARSNGVERVRTFGTAGLGPAVEVFRVAGSTPVSDFALHDLADVGTVASAVSDVVAAVGAGVLDPGRAAVLAADDRRPAVVRGDTYRLRERQFGRVRDAEGPVRSRAEPAHSDRVVGNYPGPAGARPVVASYDGIRYVDASSSQGYVTSLGAVRPDQAPFAAVDGDPHTAWWSAFGRPARDQWLQIRFPAERAFGRVEVAAPVDGAVRAWRVSAGRHSAVARVDADTGEAVVDLAGARADRLRIAVEGPVRRGGHAVIAEVRTDGLPARRTLVLPDVPTAPDASWVFTARAETRPCIPTLLGPDCSADRGRPGAESTGIDRTFTLDAAGRFDLEGTVVARAAPETARLLDPLGGPVVMRASSTYFADPTVSARMAYDGTPTTSWIADPLDPEPTLTVDFDRPRRIDRIAISAPAAPAVAPTSATIEAGGRQRVVDLGGFGRFAPLRARHLTIRFANPGRAGAPLGVGDVRLGPGTSAVPFDGGNAAGVPCGFGPNVYVDGVRHVTAVEGVKGDVASAGPLGLRLCAGPIPLGPGTHRVRVASSAEFQPVLVALRPRGETPAAAGTARPLEVVSDGDTRQVLRVGAGAAALLRTTRNLNAGWRAELDGHVLPVQRVDGWAQGWRVPAGSGGTVVVSYAPQRPYLVGLVGGLALAAVLLAAAVVLLVRTRLRPAAYSGEVLVPGRRRRPAPGSAARRVGALAGALIAGGVVGGLPVLVGLAAGLALGSTPDGAATRAPGRKVAIVVGTALLVAAPVWAAIGLHGHRAAFVVAADVLAGAGVAVLLGLLLRGRPERAPAVGPEQSAGDPGGAS